MAEPWIDTEVITAAQLAGLPWGVMGYVIGGAANQAGITAVTDITGLSVTFTAVSSRLYRTTLTCTIQQVTTLANSEIRIADGAGTTIAAAWQTTGAGSYSTLTVVAIETGLSGAITRKGRAYAGGAGTLTVYGDATNRARFTVEDIGPG